MVAKTYRLPAALVEELEAIAKASGYKSPEVVRDFLSAAIEDYREQQKRPKKPSR